MKKQNIPEDQHEELYNLYNTKLILIVDFLFSEKAKLSTISFLKSKN